MLHKSISNYCILYTAQRQFKQTDDFVRKNHINRHLNSYRPNTNLFLERAEIKIIHLLS